MCWPLMCGRAAWARGLGAVFLSLILSGVWPGVGGYTKMICVVDAAQRRGCCRGPARPRLRFSGNGLNRPVAVRADAGRAAVPRFMFKAPARLAGPLSVPGRCRIAPRSTASHHKLPGTDLEPWWVMACRRFSRAHLSRSCCLPLTSSPRGPGAVFRTPDARLEYARRPALLLFALPAPSFGTTIDPGGPAVGVTAPANPRPAPRWTWLVVYTSWRQKKQKNKCRGAEASKKKKD